MPGINGFQLVKMVKQLSPKTVIGYTSGFLGDNSLAEHANIPKNLLLNKPYTSKALIKFVDDLLKL